MNNIIVTGSSKLKREMASDIAIFVFNHLMPKMKTVEIRINLINNLIKKEEVYGDCVWLDKPNRPRKFLIRVDSNRSIDDMLKTIAHEMVHVKQFSRGELMNFDDSICKWKGNNINSEKLNYYDHPWEIEAYGREGGLFIRWAVQCRWKKKVLEFFKH